MVVPENNFIHKPFTMMMPLKMIIVDSVFVTLYHFGMIWIRLNSEHSITLLTKMFVKIATMTTLLAATLLSLYLA